MSESELAQLRGKKIGFVFQQFNLLPDLTALDNVALPMAFQKMRKEERHKRAIYLLDSVGLGKRIYSIPGKLSGGERQRVAIARALANNPEVILADEPTGNLDSKTGKEILKLFKELHKKENKTVIVVTHDESIARNSEKIYYLSDGKIIDVKKGG